MKNFIGIIIAMITALLVIFYKKKPKKKKSRYDDVELNHKYYKKINLDSLEKSISEELKQADIDIDTPDMKRHINELSTDIRDIHEAEIIYAPYISVMKDKIKSKTGGYKGDTKHEAGIIYAPYISVMEDSEK